MNSDKQTRAVVAWRRVDVEAALRLELPWLCDEPATLQNLVDGSFPIEYAFIVNCGS